MKMDILQLPVTLVVKAPNQRIGDQKVECALDWTIQKLKQHLSITYPNKPNENQQRLIYSGKLLQDHHTLKEVLKHSYDKTQTQHTVHLLCSTNISEPQVHEDGNNEDQHSGSMSTSTCSSSAESNLPSVTTEGLRQRNINTQQYNTTTDSSPLSYMPYYLHSHRTTPSGISLRSLNPAMMSGMNYSPEQIMWYQHIYAQQMTQYMQYMQQAYPGSAEAIPTTIGNNPLNQVHQQLPNAVNPQAAPQQNNNQQMVMNAAGGQAMFEDEDEDINRDWLDWGYILCRFTMLVAIVYFYSTLGRFFMVFGFFFIIYLYQSGWFRLNRRRPIQQQQAEENVAVEGQNEDYVNDNNEAASDSPPAPVENEDTEPPSPSIFRVALSFFVTFFTSLIPQQPGAVNAN